MRSAWDTGEPVLKKKRGWGEGREDQMKCSGEGDQETVSYSVDYHSK